MVTVGAKPTISYTIQARENGVPVGPLQHRVARRSRDTLFAHHLVPTRVGATSLRNYTFDVNMTDLGAQPGALSGRRSAAREREP